MERLPELAPWDEIDEPRRTWIEQAASWLTPAIGFAFLAGGAIALFLF